jgi:hypothetical protein
MVVSLTASRRGRPAPTRVVARCAAVETERSASPSRVSAVSSHWRSRRPCHPLG